MSLAETRLVAGRTAEAIATLAQAAGFEAKGNLVPGSRAAELAADLGETAW